MPMTVDLDLRNREALDEPRQAAPRGYDNVFDEHAVVTIRADLGEELHLTFAKDHRISDA